MKIIFLLISFAISGCSNIEFVYNSNIQKSILKNETILEVSGDDLSIIKVFLKKHLKEISDYPKFKLVVNSNKETKNLVVNNNQTATHIEIQYTIEYTLYKLLKSKDECVIVENKQITKSDYFVKSEGYSFGSDLSEKQVSTINIRSNIDDFINNLSILKTNFSCKNES